MTEVIWREMPGYSDYEVSSDGRVRSKTRRVPLRTGKRAGVLMTRPGKQLSPTLSGSGHLQVSLHDDDGNRFHTGIHRLMLVAFVGSGDGLSACHVNGIGTDNRLENLYWGTNSDNQLDSVRHGTHNMARVTHCPKNHPYDDENTALRPGTGYRRCMECERTSARERMRRKARLTRADGSKVIVREMVG